MDQERFSRAVAAIDAANAEDPHGKELRHAELAMAWVTRLRPTMHEGKRIFNRSNYRT